MNNKGTVIISIDYEFALGFADYNLTAQEKTNILKEVAITKRLLQLFDHYRIPVTWAVVGHLLERACLWKGKVPHPEYVRPIHQGEQRDWFSSHPLQGEYDDVMWFDAKNLIHEMSGSRVGHEIASHSYAHVLYDKNCTEEQTIITDLKNMVRVHTEAHLPVSSFVFPRNKEGRHILLQQSGIKCYRGAPLLWYERFPTLMRRGLHLFDYFLPLFRTVRAKRSGGGLVTIPQSMLLLGRGGLRKLVPVWLMKWKIKQGIRRAISRGEIFHLWFHPSNFWHDTDKQFSILESALRDASRLREIGELEIVTMQQVANRIA